MTNIFKPEPPAELKQNRMGDTVCFMIARRDYLDNPARCKRLADAWNGTREIPKPEKVPELVGVLKSLARDGHRPAIEALEAAGLNVE